MVTPSCSLGYLMTQTWRETAEIVMLFFIPLWEWGTVTEDSRQLQAGCLGKLRKWVVMFFFQPPDAVR